MLLLVYDILLSYSSVLNFVNLGPTVIGASCCGHPWPALTQLCTCLFSVYLVMFCYSFNLEGKV